jgi:hypothetical protein
VRGPALGVALGVPPVVVAFMHPSTSASLFGVYSDAHNDRPASIMSVPHVVAQMGDTLRREVQRQLLVDLGHYRVGPTDDLTIDWSDPCQEGHCTEIMGGTLEEMSDVFVRDRNGDVVAAGWIDFVHGGGDLPLHVFWLYLDLVENGRVQRVQDDGAIPSHVWSVLSEASKDAIARTDRYDARWRGDPKVDTWTRQRR